LPKRRVQQHLRQQPNRRRAYKSDTSNTPAYKPGFPMNIISSQKVFLGIGLVVVVAFMVGAVCAQATDNIAAPLPTPTPTELAAAEGTPAGSPTAAATSAPKQFSKAEDVLKPNTAYTATFATDKGQFTMELYADKSPRTVNSFVFLAQQKYFDGITFHRVVPNFVVQGGDPTARGSGGPGYETEEDPNDLSNTRGMVSMAKAGAVTKFGSQFFINLVDNAALDQTSANQKRFYPFAKVTQGMDVVDKLAQGDIIRSVTITETPK
jgi:cyclophilin family peptidyl-prolyl cis-trans isomerase